MRELFPKKNYTKRTIAMKLENSVLEKLTTKLESLEKDSTTMFAVINELKDMYIDLIKKGNVTENTFIDLASYILYFGFMTED